MLKICAIVTSMNTAQHILNQLELAQKRQLLDSLTVRPERDRTAFYLMFSSSVLPSSRHLLMEVLRTKYNCQVEQFAPDGLGIVSKDILTPNQIATLS